jgi:hypothetical protein
VTRALLVAWLLLAVAGCGARSYISAPDTRYPVSMSSAVRAPDGSVLTTGQLRKVGTFSLADKKCNMLWTLVPLIFRTEDISDDVDEQVQRARGEAIVNLWVESSATVWSVMTLFGVLPDCGNVRIGGDIVVRAT